MVLNVLDVELKKTRFYQEVFAEGQQEERLRIARSLLDVIADDRLLAEKTALSAAEVRGLRQARPWGCAENRRGHEGGGFISNAGST